MLVALNNKNRIEAECAEKGPDYICPNCKASVVLKKGRVRIHHFAHKAASTCPFSKSESQAHYTAKTLFQKSYQSRKGCRAETEFIVKTLPNDRRSDVMVFSPTGKQVGIELQDSAIGLDELEERTAGYCRAGIPVIWVPFIRKKFLNKMEKLGTDDDADFFIEQYAPRPFERWIHGFNYGEITFYEPESQKFWQGWFEDHEIYVEPTEWYNEYGEEQSGGGYSRISKRWKQLMLCGPHEIDEAKIKFFRRKFSSIGGYNYPGGNAAKLVFE